MGKSNSAKKEFDDESSQEHPATASGTAKKKGTASKASAKAKNATDGEALKKGRAMPRKKAATDGETPKKRKASSTKEATLNKKSTSEKLTADDFEPSEVNLNENLTETLLDLAKQELELGNKFKGISIKQAALLLKKYPHKICSGSEAQKLKGIGKSIAQKIDDILATEAIHKSPKSADNLRASTNSLKKVNGVSSTLAVNLVREHNVTSLVDVVDMLHQPARIGLKYRKNLREPIPASEVVAILKAITWQAEQIGELEIHECGPFTRGKSAINHIVIVIVSDDRSRFAKLVNVLQDTGLITDLMSSSETHQTQTVVKSVCLCSLPCNQKAVQTPNLFAQRSAESEAAPAAIQASVTESNSDKAFHRLLELHFCTKHLQVQAEAKGYSLTAKTLRKRCEGDGIGKQICVSSEQALFSRLGLNFVPYNERSSFLEGKATTS